MNSKYEIGPFRLDATAGVMTRGGVPVPLGSRAVAVLAALVKRPNEYVAKNSIIGEVWPDVVVEEANLTVHISAIRRVLAEAYGGERWVETLSRRGYRFVGPVTQITSNSKNKNSNLPETVTSFVGRERELIEIKRLLPQTRLLTLVGVGGIGKTRLALQLAAEVLDAYRDGVWLVELASVANPDLVPQTVAAVLGLKEEAGKSLTQSVTEHLESRHLLLVLDNAEHLLGACAPLADRVMRQCPHVVMLATSREKLGTAGEQTYPVHALSMPGLELDVTAENLAQYESARLFIERARLNLPHFAVTNENAPALASLCCRLDGIPLAIELAAARMRSMSVEELNRRLHQRFRLLTSGSVTAPRRHQTLRAMIDWSYDLLRDAEKAMLLRVSVFSGSWTAEAAEKVCVGEGIDAWGALDLLTSLADKSLLLAEERKGATRYRLLETVRQYAQERLQETGEQAHWCGRHLAYFLALAEESELFLISPDQRAWLHQLETEHDNLRVALAWSATTGGDTAAGLRLASALSRFWYFRGYLNEGRGWLSRLLAAAPGGQAAAARAKALLGAGSLATDQCDYPAARALCEEGLALYQELGDRRGIANALSNLGAIGIEQGDYPGGRALLDESLVIRRELGDRWGISTSLSILGWATIDQGDFSAAKAFHEQSLAIKRELGHRYGMAVELYNLGVVAQEQGDHRSARALFEESLAIRREQGDRRGIAESLEGLASGMAAMGWPGRAARIWGWAACLREEIGTPVKAGGDRLRYDRDVAGARAALGDDAAFDLAWQKGRALTLDQAAADAMEKQDT